MADGEKKYAIGLDLTKLRADAAEAKRLMSGITNQAMQESDKMSSAFNKAALGIGAMFSTAAATAFARKVVEVRGEIESLQISFKTLAGETKGMQLFAGIKEFAVNTPMLLNDLAKGAQTMMGFGIESDKVLGYLKELGDVSMGDSAKFQSLTLAFSQIQATGKLMGQDLLQLINAGFNPLNVISQQTGKSVSELKDEMSKGAITAEMVADAFRSATSEGGLYFNMLEKQSKGIRGSISNLQGAYDDMLNSIGENSQGIITGTIASVTELVKNYEQVGRLLASIIATYGAYKAALITVAALEKGYTISQLAQYKALLLTEKAQKLLNATMMKNPYVLAATLVIGLVTALWAFKDRTTEAEKTQKRLNDRLKEMNDIAETRKEKAKELISTLTDETQAETDRYLAFQQLQELYPAYFGNLDYEKAKIINLTDAYKDLNTEEGKRLGMEKQKELNALYLEKKRLENSITGDKNTPGFKYQNRAKESEEQLLKVNKQIAALEKEKADFLNAQSKTEEKTLETVGQRRIRQTQELADAEAKILEMKKDSSTATEEEIKKQQELITGLRKSLGLDGKNASTELINEGSLKELESKLSKLKEDLSNASTDEAKAAIKNAVKDIEAQLVQMNSRIIIMAAKAAGEATEMVSNKIQANVKMSEDFGKNESDDKLQQQTDDLHKLVEQINEARESAKDSDDDMQKMAHGVRQTAYALYQMSDALYDFADAFNDPVMAEVAGWIDSIGQLADIASQALEGMASGNPMAVIQAGIQFISNVLGASARHKRALEEIQTAVRGVRNEYNMLMLQSRLAFEAGGIFGEDSYKDAINAVEVYYNALNKLGQALRNNNTSDRNYRDKLNRNAYQGLDNIQIVTGHKKTGLFGWGKGKDTYSGILDVYPDLIDANGKFNATLAESIIQNRKMTDANKQALQSMIDYANMAEEAYKQLEEYLSDLFGNMGGDMMNAIVKYYEDGENAAEAFKKTAGDVFESLVNDMIYSATLAPIFEKASKQITDLYSNQDLTDKERMNSAFDIINSVINQAGGAIKDATDLMDYAKKIAAESGVDIYQSESQTQKATTGGFQTMSQDTGTELNGRFTAMQISMENMNSAIVPIGIDIAAIKAQNQQMAATADEHRNISLLQLGHLEDINRNTKQLFEMNDTLTAIKRDMSKL